jgi:tetratricopeptide (TPR) repeat protein
LETVRDEIWANRSIAASRTNQLNDQHAGTTKWINERLLQTAVNDSERAGSLFEFAKAYEVLLEPDLAADAIDEAVKREPDSPDMHYYRAHLMARLGRWSEEIESRRQYARLDSRELFANYRLAAALLDQGTAEEFWDAWHQWVSAGKPVIEAADTTALYASYIRDLIAKTFLVADGPDGPDRELALRYADANDGLPEAEGKDVEHWFKLTKGLAEYRRDHWPECITILDDACEGLRTFNDGEDKRGMAITRFFVAMANQRLGDHQQAVTEYLEGLDLHHRDRTEFLASQTANWTDWHLAEVARREAKQLIGIDEDAIAGKIEYTSDWTVLFEERFDDGIGDHWSPTSGQWKVSESVATGTLADGIARLDLESPQLPTTFELNYETWTSDPMLAACTLLDRNDPKPSGVQRFAMSSSPDNNLARQLQPATGVSLMTDTAFGTWFPQTNPDFTVEPGKRYNVRILRQPTRITVWVDDVQVLSSRVRKTHGPMLRFYSEGVGGTKVYLDNVKLRVPSSDAD